MPHPSNLPRSMLAGLTMATIFAGTAASQAADSKTFPSSAGPIAVSVVGQGLSHPWGIAFLPDGRLLVTERAGTMRIVKDGVASSPLAGVPKVVVSGQAGLFDVALSPDFAQSGRIYISYAEPGNGGSGLAVMAAKLVLSGTGGSLQDGKVIFRMNKYTSGSIQYGGRIVIARDGNLFITLGDRGAAPRAQDFSDLAGGVARIAPDGSIPKDNPFADGKGGAPALWSKGERNGEGAALRPSNGALYTVEHGAMGGDEINKPEAGKNYGWPVISYGVNYDGSKIGEGTAKAGMEQPLYYWDPSIAPSGMAFYDGDLFPAWKGDLLVGALKFSLLDHLKMNGDKPGNEERLLAGAYGRIRDVRVGPDGAIYLATDEDKGQILRLVPAK